jgi:hypothetical protein
MVGVLVGCDMDVATPLPQMSSFFAWPPTPYVGQISKHRQDCIH